MSIWCKKQTIEKQPRRKAKISLVWSALITAFDRLTNLVVNILFIETQLCFSYNISMTMIVCDWIVVLIFCAKYSSISSIYLNLSLLYSICVCLLEFLTLQFCLHISWIITLSGSGERPKLFIYIFWLTAGQNYLFFCLFVLSQNKLLIFYVNMFLRENHRVWFCRQQFRKQMLLKKHTFLIVLYLN